jgi:PAS domain S-box-containing protein
VEVLLKIRPLPPGDDVLPRVASAESEAVTPTRALLVVTLTILAGESLSVWFGAALADRLGYLHALVDAVLILVLTYPALHFFFVRPMRKAMRERAQAQESWRRLCGELDAKIEERTALLEDSNASLRRSEALYSSLVESSPIGIFILQDQRITFGNARFFDMVGLDREVAPRIDPVRLVHPDDWPAVRALLKKRVAGEQAVSDHDFRIRNGRGEERWVRGRLTRLHFHKGGGLLGNIMDNTEHYQAEKHLLDSREAFRQLSARLLTIQEEDRRRVAGELHDSIGQSLTAVKFMVERALKGACPCPMGGHMEVLKSVIPVIQQTVEESRRICMALRPSMLDDLGLLATLGWFVREFRKACPQIQVTLALDLEERQIPDALKISIFRITQEAVNNAAKHGRTARIHVALQWRAGGLDLTVSDHGAGFDPQAPRDPARPGGFGLASMRERAEGQNGTLVVSSTPGHGTTISARWPLVDSPDFVKRFCSSVDFLPSPGPCCPD